MKEEQKRGATGSVTWWGVRWWSTEEGLWLRWQYRSRSLLWRWGRAESHRAHELLQDGVFIRCNKGEKENFILKGRTSTSCDGNRRTSDWCWFPVQENDAHKSSVHMMMLPSANCLAMRSFSSRAFFSSSSILLSSAAMGFRCSEDKMWFSTL